MIALKGAGLATAAADGEARKIVGTSKRDRRSSKPSNFETQDALDLLACAWRVNHANLMSFERLLDQLADIGRDLRSGQCSPSVALERAEGLGFVVPLEVSKVGR